jgi:hypothetical protein
MGSNLRHKIHLIMAVLIFFSLTSSFVFASPTANNNKTVVNNSGNLIIHPSVKTNDSSFVLAAPEFSTTLTPTFNTIQSSSLSLTGVIVTSGGSGYTTPHVLLIGGGGTGATAVARISQGVVIGVVLTNPGSNYTSPPTVIFKDPSPRAKGAIATVNYSLTPVFSDGFDSGTTSNWSGGIASADGNGGSLTVINNDYASPNYSLDSILYPESGIPNFYDYYQILPTSYQALYFSESVKAVNFQTPKGWNYAIGVGGFECGAEAGYASAEIVAVHLSNGYYWGIMYPVEPFRTWMHAASNVPVVTGQWVNFVLYWNIGTGNNGEITLYQMDSNGTYHSIVSVAGFNSAADYATTGVWTGQYIANGYNTGVTTEFYMDTIKTATYNPIIP